MSFDNVIGKPLYFTKTVFVKRLQWLGWLWEVLLCCFNPGGHFPHLLVWVLGAIRSPIVIRCQFLNSGTQINIFVRVVEVWYNHPFILFWLLIYQWIIRRLLDIFWCIREFFTPIWDMNCSIWSMQKTMPCTDEHLIIWLCTTPCIILRIFPRFICQQLVLAIHTIILSFGVWWICRKYLWYYFSRVRTLPKFAFGYFVCCSEFQEVDIHNVRKTEEHSSFALRKHQELVVHVSLSWLAYIWTFRDPIKLTGITLNVVLCNFNESNRRIVSWELISLSPSVFIMTFFIIFCGLLSHPLFRITALKISFNCGDLGSPFAAYFARYSTQAWWSIMTCMSQFALHPWSWVRWWLFSRESFLFVTILALYWTVLSLVLTCSNSNLVFSQWSNGNLKRHLRSDSLCLRLRQ